MIKKYTAPTQTMPQKRNLEGTNLSSLNSFSILNNAEILNLAGNMGIIIEREQFETVEIMKDLELARHSLDKVKMCEIKNPNEGVIPISEIQGSEILALEWLEEDEEADDFTLVESKKKKKQRAQLENLDGGHVLRRSKRSTPSMYRKPGDQGNSGALKIRCLKNKKK
jgi:hypothetical protein